jgi:hypothetical protein
LVLSERMHISDDTCPLFACRAQPYEDVLPYQDFSIRLTKADIPNIGNILRNVTEDEYKTLRSNLPKYWRAFIWDTAYGGQAYNYTIASLKKRWVAMSTSLYHH